MFRLQNGLSKFSLRNGMNHEKLFCYNANSFIARSFSNQVNRISHENNKIFIENPSNTPESFSNKTTCELQSVIHFTQSVPDIEIYENSKRCRIYSIQPLSTNPNLENQYLHFSIKVLPNYGVMMDGIISSSATEHSLPYLNFDGEGIRFQPFYLSNANEKNKRLEGKGLFERGLHFAGYVTPTNVRCVCVCDQCQLSFSLSHYHTGFANLDYFYSNDGKTTLFVDKGQLGRSHEEMDHMLQISGYGEYKYYNPLRCPHCSVPFIDFEKFKHLKEQEYYGNYHLNTNAKFFKNF
ncbi:hypothetical protein C9374_004981 [Naegleria lovaniensis]|uniref:Uncharacterized protein n=1 Tax=Naegleria lovaniensis TaxID=51637 RepID=A0AA88KIN5_NAELO|nr:uncharacterized protein C9374_004981 [Naegleria lovaniensis]KAG2383014.1 hypothetical protein C9374_004981 [Naegleria lovaniensis]